MGRLGAPVHRILHRVVEDAIAVEECGGHAARILSASVQSLRLLVVGHGLIGRQRAAAASALAGILPVTIAATVDPVERDPALYGGAPHHRALVDVDPDGYDAAVIALPHDLAGEAAGAVLSARRPVLVEKPLALTGRQARALEVVAQRLERPSFVGYNYRFLPHVADLFAAVVDEGLGRLRCIDMLIGHGGHPGSADGWKLRPERAGGGVLLDPGVHLLDLLLMLNADLTFTHVAGTRGFWGTGIEEDLVATFAHDALLATMRVSHIRWVNTLRIDVVGDDGYALLEGRGGNYGPMTVRVGRRWAWHHDAQGRSQRETETACDHGASNRSLEDELEAVLRRWLGESPPSSGPRPATMSEGRRVTELCEAMYGALTIETDRQRVTSSPAPG
jgi:1,5-anhydro-D-fructose reductase (1,5-anhydro-D-mannitol-forming)